MGLDVNAVWRYAPVERWTGGAAAVILLTFDVDAETMLLGEEGGDNHASDLSSMSHGAFGATVGLDRLLRMLERHGKPATFFIPGWTAEHHPQCVERVAAAGHEIALHGYLHRPPSSCDQDEQRVEIERSLKVFEKLGVCPVGYRAPVWMTTSYTLEQLGSYGLQYDSSLMDDDKPYLLDTPSGRLAELPPQWYLDDAEQYLYLPYPGFDGVIQRPAAVADAWKDEVDAYRAIHSLLVLTAHPCLSGRPARVRALEHVIEYAESLGDVEFARCDQVAARLLETPDDELLQARPGE